MTRDGGGIDAANSDDPDGGGPNERDSGKARAGGEARAGDVRRGDVTGGDDPGLRDDTRLGDERDDVAAPSAVRREGDASTLPRPTGHKESMRVPLDVAGAVEALLLVTDQPVTSAVLSRVLERPEAEVETALSTLAKEYEDRGSGIDVRCVAGGWRLYTRAEFSPFVERFLVDGQQARLTQAALETLAVIAYRQPVTRSRVSAVRGVNVDGVVRTLVARGLVTEVGHDDGSGAALYATTELFLERIGVASLDDLPSLAPLLPELADLEHDSTST